MGTGLARLLELSNLNHRGIDNGPSSIVDDQSMLACYSNVARPDLDGGAEFCNLLAILGCSHLINQSQTTRNLPPTSSEVGSSYNWTPRFRRVVSSTSDLRSDSGPPPSLRLFPARRSAIWLIKLNSTPGYKLASVVGLWFSHSHLSFLFSGLGAPPLCLLF